MSVRTMLRMRVRDGAGEEFSRAWLVAAEAIAKVPGNRAQALLREAGDPLEFVVVADWADRGALERFGRGPERERLTEVLRELRVRADRVTYEVVHELEGEDR